jgi:hypothetical protein
MPQRLHINPDRKQKILTAWQAPQGLAFHPQPQFFSRVLGNIVFGQNFDLRFPRRCGSAKAVRQQNSGTEAMCFVINVCLIAIESWLGGSPYTLPYRPSLAQRPSPPDRTGALRLSCCAVCACHRPVHRPGPSDSVSLGPDGWQASPSGDRLAPGKVPAESDCKLVGLTKLNQ